MVSRSSDLAPYLRKPAGRSDPLSYRQGTVVSWDQQTAENVIRIGEELFEDLACLNTSEASLLVPGDVVGVMVAGSTWAVMGRLIIPGSAEAASSIKAITSRIQAASDPFSGTRNSTAWGDLSGVGVGPSIDINVGPSGRVLCFWSCELGQAVQIADPSLMNYMVRNTPHVGVQVSGATSISANDLNALNLNLEFPPSGTSGDARALTWLQASMMHLFTGLNPGLTTFTMKYRHDTLTPASLSSFGAREIAVFAL